MNTTKPLKEILCDTDNLAWVRQALIDNAGARIGKFCDIVCEHFDVRDRGGRLQSQNCYQALKAMDRQGIISLRDGLGYEPVAPGRSHKPRCLDDPVPLPSGLPEDAGQVRDLQIVRCETELQKRTWNTILEGEHYLGADTPPGGLIKYMAKVDGQIAAAGCFCSARRGVWERDEWIGWTYKDQKRHRDDVLICMGRFLVREGAHGCRNLPSKILGAMLDAVRVDWAEKYGAGPFLIETYVDPARFKGTCYKAANWIYVGDTAGRGYDDRERKAEAGEKQIYMYPLVPDFRERLGLLSPEQRELPAWALAKPLAPCEGLKGDSWAWQEFGGADIGSRASVKRLAYSAEILALNPDKTAGKAFGIDNAAREGWYRLLDNENVTPEGILKAHVECTLMRAKGFKVILLIQDTMVVSLRGKRKTRGLGPVWSRDGSFTPGLYEHGTIAAEPEQELFLGVVSVTFWVRQEGGKGPGRLPPDERESAVWRRHAQEANEMASYMPGTLAVTVCDRGADAWLLIHEVLLMKHLELVVRARADRWLPEENSHLFALMAGTRPCGEMEVTLQRTTERRNNAGGVTVRGHPELTVKVDVIFRRVKLPPPPEMPDASPAEVVCVVAVERGMPKNRERVHWILITTLPVKGFEDAKTVVSYYDKRWIIEEWHGMLKKDCCDIESLAYRTVERVKNAIAVYMVVSWWLMLPLQLARKNPELPPDTVFSKDELEELQAEADEAQKKTAF